MKSLNFDANGCFGMHPKVRDGLTAEVYLNPSSVHRGGQRARALVEHAREKLLELCGLSRSSHRVIFCSGATEANNIAIFSQLLGGGEGGCRSVVTGATEHSSVLESIRYWSRAGAEVVVLPPSQASQQYDLGVLPAGLQLAAFMLANNETGRIYDLKTLIGNIRAQSGDSWIHVDAVQGLGKIEHCLAELDFDSASISAHKFGGCTGVGALIVKKDREGALKRLIQGGPQEGGLRGGTQNVLGIASMVLALEVVQADFHNWQSKYKAGRSQLLSLLDARGISYVLNAQISETLSNTLSIRFPGILADDLIVALDMRGVLCSAGSACSSGKPSPSHVLLAEGLSEEQARESVRVSFSGLLSDEDLREGIEIFVATVSTMTGTQND